MKAKKNHDAFTLVELLVTVAIIGILVGLVVGVSGLASKRSSISKALSEMQLIRHGLEEYRLKYGAYPSDLDKAVERMPIDFQQVSLTDPWGRPYVYSNINNIAFTLISKGPSASDVADDIDSAAGKM